MNKEKDTITQTLSLSFEVRERSEVWNVRLIPVGLPFNRKFFVEIRPEEPIEIGKAELAGINLDELVVLLIREKISLFARRMCSACIKKEIEELRKNQSEVSGEIENYGRKNGKTKYGRKTTGRDKERRSEVLNMSRGETDKKFSETDITLVKAKLRRSEQARDPDQTKITDWTEED